MIFGTLNPGHEPFPRLCPDDGLPRGSDRQVHDYDPVRPDLTRRFPPRARGCRPRRHVLLPRMLDNVRAWRKPAWPANIATA